MRALISASTLLSLSALVQSHGIIVSPVARDVGPAMEAVCSKQGTSQLKSDKYGTIQGTLQVAKQQKDFQPSSCNFFLCKGMQFEDNKANVQTVMPGQVIPFTIDIRAPHTGKSNVSIVDTKKNQMIGQPLKVFDDYASTAHTIPPDNKQFSITMPMDLGGQCTQPGNCVVQWFWDGAQQGQTYESCVDFTMGGGSAPAAQKRDASPQYGYGPKPPMSMPMSMSMGMPMTMSMGMGMPTMTMPMVVSMSPMPMATGGVLGMSAADRTTPFSSRSLSSFALLCAWAFTFALMA